VDLVNPRIEYPLNELLLIAQLPNVTNLRDPNDELAKFKQARD
jgi:hypothetical protein